MRQSTVTDKALSLRVCPGVLKCGTTYGDRSVLLVVMLER